MSSQSRGLPQQGSEPLGPSQHCTVLLFISGKAACVIDLLWYVLRHPSHPKQRGQRDMLKHFEQNPEISPMMHSLLPLEEKHCLINNGLE